MDNTEDITVLSLCTGYGGLEIGLHRALGRSLRVVAVEIEAFAAANLVAKAEEGKLAIEALYPDLKTFPAERFSGCFDFILAGYPCQPFSVAGKRKGEADPRHLWPFIKDHIKQIRPVWVFLENVAGHLRLGFDRVVRDLDELGYRVEADLFTASEVGAPHKRERLFILAYAESVRTMRESGTVRRSDGRQGETLPRQLIESDSELAHTGFNDGRERQPEQQQKELSEEFPRGDKLADTELQGLHERGQYQTRQIARPGETQYDWEEPRTVESGMGRTVDGFASRVDELRLLGNGVVPAQAELAFRTLWEKLITTGKGKDHE